MAQILDLLLPDERKLFADTVRRLDRKIMPGLTKLTWASKGVVEFFVKDCRKNCAEVLRIVQQVRAGVSPRSCVCVHSDCRCTWLLHSGPAVGSELQPWFLTRGLLSLV